MREFIYLLDKKVEAGKGSDSDLKNRVVSAINNRLLSGPPRRNLPGGFGNLAPTLMVIEIHIRTLAAQIDLKGL